MSDSGFVSASGAVARLRQLEVVANNLANANTVGFKRDHTVFSAMLESRVAGPGGQPAAGAAGLVFVEPGSVSVDARPGNVVSTGSPLDVALLGEGFFEVETPEGVRLTRAGSFAIGPGGQLVSQQGHPVRGAGGAPIEVGERPIEITATGEVVDDQGQSVGRLGVVEVDPAALVKDGRNLFRLGPEGFVVPVLDPRFAERSIEGSNVQPVHALAELMMIQRSFEASLQTLQADDGATQALIREISS